jgi:hypothetical protein
MEPEEMRLPKLSEESFQLTDASYWWRQSVPPNPIVLQRILEKEELRAVMAVYFRAQAAAAEVQAKMHREVADIIAGQKRDRREKR